MYCGRVLLLAIQFNAEAIPIMRRIVAQAASCERPLNKAFSHCSALGIIRVRGVSP